VTFNGNTRESTASKEKDEVLRQRSRKGLSLPRHAAILMQPSTKEPLELWAADTEISYVLVQRLSNCTSSGFWGQARFGDGTGPEGSTNWIG